MLTSIQIRDYLAGDAAAVDALAVSAFEQYRDAYTDWSAFKAKIASMSALASSGELVVACAGNTPIGAVAYVGTNRPKAEFFRPEWPIMRMLVVSPSARGKGVGRALAEECLSRARRDGATVFALHTSELMSVALPMYLRMGFEWFAEAPIIHGVRYGVYVKNLTANLAVGIVPAHGR